MINNQEKMDSIFAVEIYKMGNKQPLAKLLEFKII